MTKIVRKPETPTLLLTRSKIQRGPTMTRKSCDRVFHRARRVHAVS